MDVIATVVDQQVQFTETVTEDSLWKPLDPEDPDLLERIELRHRLREIHAGGRANSRSRFATFRTNSFVTCKWS